MRAVRPHVRVALAIPGQGSQAIGMGKLLHAEYPAARAVFDRVASALRVPLQKTMFEGPKEHLTRTAFAQPAILTHAVASFEALKVGMLVSSLLPVQVELKENDVQKIATVALGHSVGEIAALCIAGSIELEDAARLLQLRGEAMQKAVPTEGAMSALIPTDEATAQKICAQAEQETGKVVDVANVNSAEQVVISGDAVAVARASELSKKHGVRRVMPLEVSAPFHCRLMDPAAEALAEALNSMQLRSPLIPVLSNVTGTAHGAAEEIRAALVKQVTAPVRWHACILEARSKYAIEELYELGPGEVLSNLAKKLKPPLRAASLATPVQIKDALNATVQPTVPSVHDFLALAIDRKTTVNMRQYQGKVLLFVNVASRCGFTPQYTELEALYRKYKDKGLVVLGFPCNQFGWQEPGTEAEIAQFCSTTYNVTFPMFAKVDVNGSNAAPLWTFLKSANETSPKSIKWNFTKFLVDKNGKVVQRFGAMESPRNLEEHIKKLL